MLMLQSVLVMRLSGMEGSFLWRSQRLLHGKPSKLEHFTPLFKRDPDASFCTDLPLIPLSV
jgi:hypothetical protein